MKKQSFIYLLLEIALYLAVLVLLVHLIAMASPIALYTTLLKTTIISTLVFIFAVNTTGRKGGFFGIKNDLQKYILGVSLYVGGFQLITLFSLPAFFTQLLFFSFTSSLVMTLLHYGKRTRKRIPLLFNGRVGKFTS